MGLLCTIEDCERQILRNVTAQGFKFGVVVPEMTNADFIHISDCEYAMCFIDATHLTVIKHLSTHNNRRCICALPVPDHVAPSGAELGMFTMFGCNVSYRQWDVANATWYKKSYLPTVNVRILAHDYEVGHFAKPFVAQMAWGVWDPQNRMHGEIFYHQGFPGGTNDQVLQQGSGHVRVIANLISANMPPEELSGKTAYEIERDCMLSACDIISADDLRGYTSITDGRYWDRATSTIDYGKLQLDLEDDEIQSYRKLSAMRSFD